MCYAGPVKIALVSMMVTRHIRFGGGAQVSANLQMRVETEDNTGALGMLAPVRVTEFIDTVFPRFAELKAGDRHPKWREINLGASWPGLTKAHAAEAWLARQQTMSAAAASTAPSPTSAQSLGANEKEALFKQFMEWQRAKGH